MFLNCNSQKPQPAQLVVKASGSCSPKLLSNSRLRTSDLRDLVVYLAMLTTFVLRRFRGHLYQSTHIDPGYNTVQTKKNLTSYLMTPIVHIPSQLQGLQFFCLSTNINQLHNASGFPYQRLKHSFWNLKVPRAASHSNTSTKAWSKSKASTKSFTSLSIYYYIPNSSESLLDCS